VCGMRVRQIMLRVLPTNPGAPALCGILKSLIRACESRVGILVYPREAAVFALLVRLRVLRKEFHPMEKKMWLLRLVLC